MLDTNLLLELLFVLLFIGAFAGILAGLLGVGGGIVLVPAFFFAFEKLGYNGTQMMQVCLGTSLSTIIVTSIRSLLSHNRKGAVDWNILKGWAPGIIIGAIIGVTTVTALHSSTLQIIFGIMALIVGLYMAIGSSKWRIAEHMPQGIKQYIFSPILGFLSVLMGIGGGSFGVPFMTLHNVPIHRAVATAAGFGVLIAIPSAIGFLLLTISPDSHPPYTFGAVNIPAFLIVIAMTSLTAPLGVKLAHTLNPKPLKRIFGIFLILVALNMLRKVFF